MSMAEPLVSVIIPTYNRPQAVEHAIRSFMAQTYPHFEIIVINDGGTDVTAAVSAVADRRVRCLNKPHGGLASARNWGLREAHGEYVTFCDDDDDVLPERLEHHLAHLAATGVAVSFCNAYVVTDRQTRLFFQHPPEPSFPGLFYRRNPPVHAFLAARECLRSVGGFNETLRVCEDYDLWLRLLPSERFGYLDEPLVRYNRHPQAMSQDRQLMSQVTGRIATAYFQRHRSELTQPFRKKFARLMTLRQVRRQLRSGNLTGLSACALRLLRSYLW